MRVLALLHMYVPVHNAGAETHTHAMLRALVTAGHQVTVQLSQPLPDGDYECDGIAVHGWKHKRDPFDHLPADVIVTHLENTPRATVIGQMTGTPVVHLCHNDMTATARWLCHRAVALAVFNSEWMKASLRSEGFNGPDVVVHPYPDPAEYATTPGDRVTLVNCWPPKGGEVLVRLAERMPATEFLAVAGAYGQPQLLPRLPNVEVLAHTPNVRDEVLSRTRVLLMPSEYESFGRIGAEAMTAGIPVIAHPTPGLRENLGEAGTYVDRDDVDGWQAAVMRLSRPRAWNAASRAARARSAEQAQARAAELAAFVHAVEFVAAHAVRRTA